MNYIFKMKLGSSLSLDFHDLIKHHPHHFRYFKNECHAFALFVNFMTTCRNIMPISTIISMEAIKSSKTHKNELKSGSIKETRMQFLSRQMM